jgi:predicted transcriptional regulator
MVVALIGGFWALVKIIVSQFNKNLDVRFKAQEEVRTGAQSEWTRRFDELSKGQRDQVANQRQLEQRFNKHLETLPLEYWRREDAIRQEVAIVSRLDGLAAMVVKKFDQTDEKIEALRRAK